MSRSEKVILLNLVPVQLMSSCAFWDATDPGGVGGGGVGRWEKYPRFQVSGIIEWGRNEKPQKIHGPKINPQKMPCRVNLTFQTHKSQVKEIKSLLQHKGIPVMIKPDDKHDE